MESSNHNIFILDKPFIFFSKNSLCGYQIRMESRTGEATRLLYCTTGVLLRKLQEDVLLSNVSHVIVDEVSNTFLIISKQHSYSSVLTSSLSFS